MATARARKRTGRKSSAKKARPTKNKSLQGGLNTELLLKFFAIFLIANAIGVLVGQTLLSQGVSAYDNPDAPENSAVLMLYILGFTAILIIVMRRAPGWFTYVALKIVESLAVFGSALIVFYTFGIDDTLALVIGAALVASRLIFKESLLLRNICTTIAAAGSGALIGASLGIVPAGIFVVLIAAYDLIAVFRTKHMVELAKGLTGKNLAFTFALPTKDKKFELGSGDIVVPLAFAVSVMGEAMKTAPGYAPYATGIILLASLLGIAITLEIASRTKKPMPAVPLQALYMLIALAIMKLTFLA